jgi:hypothetical protein
MSISLHLVVFKLILRYSICKFDLKTGYSLFELIYLILLYSIGLVHLRGKVCLLCKYLF